MTLYLSRLFLNPRNRQVRSELSRPYELHRTIMRAFPESLPESERVLYRIEIDRQSGIPLVLVQSLSEPNWQRIRTEDYFLPPFNGQPNPVSKPFAPRMVEGQALAFRLKANPTRKVKRDDPNNKNGARVGLYREEEQLAWLNRKAQNHGFTVLEARTSNADTIKDYTHKLQFLGVQFDGLLQITHLPTFEHTLRAGIGSGKGLGFGLLSLAPPS